MAQQDHFDTWKTLLVDINADGSMSNQERIETLTAFSKKILDIKTFVGEIKARNDRNQAAIVADITAAIANSDQIT